MKSTLFPFVLLLGNHSSGKSSFVNYLLNRKIQAMGVAPTDDCFTLIAPSDCQEIDRDGNSLVGDPDLGFTELKSFGPVLVHRTQLKIRMNTAVKNFMIVDSPGMIDSPLVKDHFGSGRHAIMDRGYDFEAVCRWYAERADVILLFFDPDKPGTTGETLSILTNSLAGMDHKLHIILNKADQFRKIHDFARAYGSLCWNLSKVIQRKHTNMYFLPYPHIEPTCVFSDHPFNPFILVPSILNPLTRSPNVGKDMPQIHTMCLPIGADGGFTAGSGGNGGGKTQGQGLGPAPPGPSHRHDKATLSGSQGTGLVQGTGTETGQPIAAVVTSIVPAFADNKPTDSGVNGDDGGNGKTKLLQLGNSPYNATTTITNNTAPVLSDKTDNHNNGTGSGGRAGGGAVGLESYESEFLRSGYADLAESRMEVIVTPYQYNL